MARPKTRRQTAAEASLLEDLDPNTSSQSEYANGDASIKHSSSLPTGIETEENIFLFIPNLIGYARIILAGLSLYYMPLHPRTCSILYAVSCLLDAVDGLAARHFGQSTSFGAVLDMVTDRCTTACLLVFLSSAFPRWAIVFQGLISLDLASHYMHMYATLSMGGRGRSHKVVESSRSRVLNLYYSNNKVLFAFCAGNELFFLALYLLSFSSPTLSPSILQPFSQYSPYSAAALEMARANKLDSFWPWVLAGTSAPIMLAKQIVNVVQMVKAARWIAEGDRKTRIQHQRSTHKRR